VSHHLRTEGTPVKHSNIHATESDTSALRIDLAAGPRLLGRDVARVPTSAGPPP